jgi:hypothetical protein
MKKYLLKVSVTALLVFSMTMPTAFASDIPSSVQSAADAKVSQNESIPELRAWETDLNGNIKEVVPLSLRTKSGITIMSPPSNDGMTYVFSGYQKSATPTRDWHYKNLGIFRYVNGLNTKANITYEQTASNQGSWSVGLNISADAKARLAFFGEIEYSIGGKWDMSRSWTKGTKYGATQEIPPKTTAYLTNYQVAANSNGLLVWNRYTANGGSLGTYSETAGGYAISMSDVNIEVTSTEPVH